MTNKTEISAVGIPGGDCECWCLDVSEQECIRIKGLEDYNLHKSMEDEFYTPVWRLYPSDFMDDVDGKKSKNDSNCRSN